MEAKRPRARSRGPSRSRPRADVRSNSNVGGSGQERDSPHSALAGHEIRTGPAADVVGLRSQSSPIAGLAMNEWNIALRFVHWGGQPDPPLRLGAGRTPRLAHRTLPASGNGRECCHGGPASSTRRSSPQTNLPSIGTSQAGRFRLTPRYSPRCSSQPQSLRRGAAQDSNRWCQ